MSKSYIGSLLVVGVTALFASAGCNSQNGSTSCKVASDCLPTQNCVSGKCVAKTPVNPPECKVASDCSPTQNCVSGKCVAKTPINPPECKGDDGCKGKPGTICHKGACVTATECDAGSPCADPTKQFCDNGYCRQIESCASNPEICGDGRICVKNECLATTGCMGSDECKPTERCKEGACIDIMGKTDLCKLGFLSCGTGYRCEFNNCVPNCNDPCGGKCCGTAEVCYKDTCVAPCGTGEEMCGDPNAPQCCAAGTGCFGGQCKPLGDKCDESAEKYCTYVRYCDAKYASCVKYEDAPDLCLLPTVDEFHGKVKLQYDTPTHDPTYNSLYSLPVVADLTGDAGRPDGWPDVVLITYKGENYGGPGILRIIRGAPLSDDPTDVKEYWQSNLLVADPAKNIEPFWANPNGSPAVGDINGDNIPDIVVTTVDSAGKPNGFRVVSGGDGATILKNENIKAGYRGVETYSISNLDYAGRPEIIVNKAVIDGMTGQKLCDLPDAVSPIVANLDEKGNKEIIVGTTIYSFERTASGATCTPKNTGVHADLDLSAVADIYPSLPGPEIVTVSSTNREVIVSDRDGNKLWGIALGGSSGGPPTIADFDGDEKLEIAYADMNYYTIIKPADNPHTAGTKMWSKETKDKSSGFTGSSVFDFDGDGKAEAVYYDEDYLRIYDGATGRERMKMDNSNVTGAEYPVIVDVDNDGHADIVVAGNLYTGNPPKEPGSHKQTPGLRVITDRDNKWVSTRKIWNQHDYHYTNVNDDGTIPQNEKHHWKEAWSNTFRQNVQKGNNRLAPDITVKFASLFGASCNASTQRTLRYTIRNEGDKEVAAGAITNVLSVRKTGTTTYDVLDSRTNTQKLAPGDSELVTFDWNIPTKYQSSNLDFKVEADHGNAIIECREDNTAENLNVAVASPNLSVNLNQSFACSASSSGFSTPINFELSNSGAVAVPAGKAEVTIQFKKSDGTVVKEVKIKNTEEIPAQGYINMNSTVDFSLSSSSNIISLDLVISVKLAPGITECSEADNEISKAGAVICYSFG